MPEIIERDFIEPEKVIGAGELTRADYGRLSVIAKMDGDENFVKHWWKGAATSYDLAAKLCKALAETE